MSSFSNVHGEAFDPSGTPTKPKRSQPRTQRASTRAAATISRGFLVSGVRPEVVAPARADAASKGRLFDEGAFLRNHAKRERLRPTPYELLAAAEQCAELACKAGWLDVRVEEQLATEMATPSGGLW